MNSLVTQKVHLANHFSETGKTYKAESLYKQAQSRAVEEAGEDSALEGYVLNELMSFYEQQGRSEEANACWEQIRKTITLKVENGLIKLPKAIDTQNQPQIAVPVA